MDKAPFNSPKNLADYAGQFVLFFAEDEEPIVLFNTPVAEDAYKRAEEIKKAENREPVVIRIQENPQNNIAELLAIR
jgi:hypothetical protein